jgi:type I restriction enzyme S subunit
LVLDGAIVSSHYFIFQTLEDRLDRRFLGWFVKTPMFRGQVEAQGSTNYAAIRPANVLSYKIPLPPIREQRRLVQTIGALDKTISTARSLREQAKSEITALQASHSRRLFESLSAPVVPLQEVCEAIIDNLHSNPVYDEGGTVPCIRSPDVGFGVLDLDNARRTNEAEYARRIVRGAPRTNDIVLVREGGGTGKCALVTPGPKFSLGQRVMMLRPRVEVVDPRYFLYQLLSPVIQEDHIQPLSKGSASPHLNIGALRRFPFVLPSVEDQKKIVAEFDRLQAQLDVVRKLQAETTAELNAMLPAVLDKAFRGEL